MDGEGSAWAIKPGTAWAEEVEAEEAKHGPMVSEEAFPSLGEAIKQPQPKGKKQKGQKMLLSDFAAFPVGRRAQMSDKELLMNLPKSSSGLPKEERPSGALGGGFKDYGGNRQQGGFGDRERGGREEREPSRADTAGDWGAERKFVPSSGGSGGGSGFGGGGYRDREGGFGGERRGGGSFSDRPPREERPVSEADTVDDWGANRKYQPAADSARPGGGGFGAGGGGFRDRERPAGGAPRFADEPSRADQGDWGARRSTPEGDRPGPAAASRRGYGFSDQPMSQADMEDKWSHRGPPPGEAAGSSADRAGPAERPKLKLAPRTKPLPEQQQPQQQANGAAASPKGSDAGSSGSGPQQQQEKPRKSNPFGAARPREEVLKEKGIDYQKEELKLEHGEVLRDATPEETEMEAEVEAMRKQLEELQTATPDETDTISDLKKDLDEKERALYTLQAKLDDELRYSKHKPERSEREGPARSNPSAEDMTGFEPVRNPRSRAAPAAAAGEAAPAASGGSKQQEGSSPAPAPAAAAAAAAAGGGGGAWGRGGGGFRDRERDGGRGSGGGFGGGFREGGRDGGREGGREGGRDAGRGPPPPKERRAGAGGGW